MHKPTSIFIATMVLFAAGTSAIGYSLASESYTAAKPVRNVFTAINIDNIPWYCVSTKAKVRGQGVDDAPGYYPSGYYPSGYNAPATPAGYNIKKTPPSAGYMPPSAGYQPSKPGYTPPAAGYQATKPGYQVTIPVPIMYQVVNLPAKLQPNEFNSKWQSSISPCPTGYTFDEALVVKKCSLALQKKLDGNPLPAESKEQYNTCQKILSPSMWNAKISQKICSAFYLYENDCASAQKARRACQPLSKYLVTASVAREDIPKTQSDTIYLCKDVYPKP